ncbi:hypothetical protein, partial [Dolichospermum sp. UHCC 0352]|uniref:hypothetical protein n=1 Tax=Dolichospermum sp. UHCC 0352 TaxID=2590011 RepID=UPI001C2C94BB
WNHTDPFPNSEVKRCCGDDSLGVALRENSSMPGLLFNNNAPSILLDGVLFFGLLYPSYLCSSARNNYLII